MRAMKDGLDKTAIERLAKNLSRAQRGFDRNGFVKRCLTGHRALELRQRVDHIIGVLSDYLPARFSKASGVLTKAATSWDRGDPDDPLAGFAAWPAIDYVGVYGVDDFDLGLETLRQLTGLFTAEFAIRPFLSRDAEAVFRKVESWLDDDNPAVRRLCSEGLRPRLPWGKSVAYLKQHPGRIIDVLDRLAFDDSEVVQRSVANNLNDIAKTHPELVLKTCRRWLKQSPEQRREATRRLVTRATRTLIKEGNPGALSLAGAARKPAITLERFGVTPRKVTLGGILNLSAVLYSIGKQQQKLIVDFVVHHQKANGTTRPKVFKWQSVALGPGARVELSKRHSIRLITTRRYYAGEHRVEVLVNGVVKASAPFTLELG